jgi:hypothetical protein
MIVDKHIDLNFYKEGTDFLNQDEVKAGEGSSDIKAGVGDDVRPSCCGPRSAVTPKEKAGCAIPIASGPQLSKLIAGTDFNEWVGESLMPCAQFLLLFRRVVLTRYEQVHSTFTLSSRSELGG